MSRAVLWCWLYRLVACALVAAPWSCSVGEHVVHVAGGDAVLWEAGGLWSTEVARWLEPGWPLTARRSSGIGLVAAVGWWAMIGGLVGECAGHRRPWAASWGRIGSLWFLAGAATLLQAIVLVGAGLAVLVWPGGGWFLAPLAAAWWLAVSASLDVARVARFRADTWTALQAPWSVLTTRRDLWWSGIWRWGLAMSFLVAGLAGAQGIAVSGGSAAGVLTLPALGILGWTVLRASWLRRVSHALGGRGEATR